MESPKRPVIRTLTLRSGDLRFSALTAGDGPAVLMLHGFPDSAATFDEQICALAAKGYRVIAPQMRGYEPSSQPIDQQYYAVNMAQDVIHWLDDLNLKHVHLVGHDWGSTIAYAATTLAPERFLSLAMLAVPHPIRFHQEGLKVREQMKKSWYLLFFQIPGLSDWIIKRNNFQFLEYLWRKWSPKWTWRNETMSELKCIFSQPGVLSAALAYYRKAIDTRSELGKQSAALLNGGHTVPTLGVTGETDGCIGNDVFLSCMRKEDFPGGLHVKQIEKAGHFFHQEAPEEFNKILIDWLLLNNP